MRTFCAIASKPLRTQFEEAWPETSRVETVKGRDGSRMADTAFGSTLKGVELWKQDAEMVGVAIPEPRRCLKA